jgi:hypothetical protein
MTGHARIRTTIFVCRIINLTSKLECKDKLKIKNNARKNIAKLRRTSRVGMN